MIYWHHNDHLGTPQAMTDINGTVVWTMSQTPFGIASVNEDPDGDGLTVTNNFRMPGQYYDQETGLFYNYQRTLDPTLGRYIQSDPIGLNGGMNTFGYAGGNPVVNIDVRGLFVTVDYYQSSGRIIVVDNETGKTACGKASSGGVPYGDPIPSGAYEILDQARNPESFRLDAIDSNPRNDVHEATGRDRFRLHEPGNTIGCIAVTDRDRWNEIRNLINSTRTDTVMDNAIPWWTPWRSPTPIVRYGNLYVH